jgi:hypothetical protein
VTETDQGLSRLQRDILELEARTWKQPGSKISEFRRRHPRITETGYYLALLRLLENPAAYEYGGRRYAPLLSRLSEKHQVELARRASLRESWAGSTLQP